MKGATLDEDSGLRIVHRALEEPLRRIVANAGQEPSVVVDRVEAGLTPVLEAGSASASEAGLTSVSASALKSAATTGLPANQPGAAWGYNAATGEYGDLLHMGVIDPAKVTRLALQNAGSIAGLILMTDCIVARPARHESGPPHRSGAAPMEDDLEGEPF